MTLRVEALEARQLLSGTPARPASSPLIPGPVPPRLEALARPTVAVAPRVATASPTTPGGPRAVGAAGTDRGPAVNPVAIDKALRAEALGLEGYYHYVGDDVGAGMQHLANVANGNSLLRWTPFASPGRGLATVVDLTYNSLEERSRSPIGNNFSLSLSGLTRLGDPLDIHPNKADVIPGQANRWIGFTDGDGTTHRFEGVMGGDGTVSWREPPGVDLYLRPDSSTDSSRRWALTRPDGVTFHYDADGFPTGVEDRNGNRLVFTLEDVPPGDDPGGPRKRVTAVTDAAGIGANPSANRRFLIDYYTKDEVKKPQVRGKIRRITDHNGSALDFEYYDDGNLLRITQRGGSKADGSPLADRSLVFTYTTSNGAGPAIPAAAGRANPAPGTPNQSTSLHSVRDPNGRETLFSYVGPRGGHDRGKLATRTDRAGATTSFAYNTTDRVTTVTAPLSRVSKYAYDADGEVTAITNPMGQTTTLQWNADRAVTRVTEPAGAFTRYAYNANGDLTDQWDQLGNHTHLEYEGVRADPDDVGGRWEPGRTIPHVSRLKTVTRPKGTATTATPDDYQWRFDYDARGNLTLVTDPEKGVSRYAYNQDGTLAAATDANNHVTRFPSYDPNGLATQVVDAKGQTTSLGYDDDGLLRWVQDPLHAGSTGGDPRRYRAYFDYDSFHRLGRQSAPKSTALAPGVLVWSAADYDANDNLTTQVAPYYTGGVGARTTTTYDAMDRPVLVTGPDRTADPAGERTRYLYDAAGRLSRITSPKGVLTTNTDKDFAVFLDYDPLDRVVREIRYEANGAGAVTQALTTHYGFDLAGDLRSVTAPMAGLTTVTDPATAPYTTRYEYDAAHRRLAETAPLGHRTSVTYDANGNTVASTDEQNNTTRFAYDRRDLLTTVVEPFVTGAGPRALTTRIEYDAVGNRTRLISPRAWDASPDKVSFTQFVTSYRYDALDQLVRVDLPTSADSPQPYSVHNAFDANGNLVWTSLPVTTADPARVTADRKTVMEYFDTGMIRTSNAPGTPKVHFDYSAEGWQTSRTTETPAGGLDTDRQVRWTYDADGQLLKVTGRGGRATTFAYDANNNLVRSTASPGPGGTETPIDTTVSYDGFDRVAKVRDKKQGAPNWGFTTYAYDRNGNVVERVDNGEESPAGEIVKAGRKQAYSYDQADWLTTQMDYGTKPTADDDQRILTAYWPTGLEKIRTVQKSEGRGGWVTKQETSWDYFANGKLRELTTRANRDGTLKVVESHTVSYDDAGRRYNDGHRTRDVFTRLVRDESGGERTVSGTAAYGYDPRGRLVHDDNGLGAVTDYTLDGDGNIRKEEASRQGVKQTRTFDYVGSQLKTVTDGLSVADYSYDPDGNLDKVNVSAGGSSYTAADYTYDPWNRLKSLRSFNPNGTADRSTDYTYDAFDRVVDELEQHGTAASRRTRFSYLGLEDQVTEERHEDGKDASKVLSTKSYAYDSFGHRISMTNTTTDGASESYTYGYDVHGSVSLLLDQAGRARASYGYTAYGAEDRDLTREDSKDPNNPLNAYRYSGRRLDTGSGTIDMGARRFGPDTGRFLQRDVFDDALADLNLSADPLSQNRYSLAGGNPISFVEVDGHMVARDGGGGSSSSPSPRRRRHRRPTNPAGVSDAASGNGYGPSDGGDGKANDPSVDVGGSIAEKERGKKTQFTPKLAISTSRGGSASQKKAEGHTKIGPLEARGHADVNVLNRSVGANFGVGKKGVEQGVSASVSGAKASAGGSIGTKKYGLTGQAGAEALSAGGEVGIRDGSVGASAEAKLATVSGGLGATVAGRNVGVNGEVGLKLGLGLQLGKRSNIKFGPVSIGFSIG